MVKDPFIKLHVFDRACLMLKCIKTKTVHLMVDNGVNPETVRLVLKNDDGRGKMPSISIGECYSVYHAAEVVQIQLN